MFRPKSPVPEPESQGDELADSVPFGLGAKEEEGNDEETLAPSEPVLPPDTIAKREHRHPRLGLLIGGGVLAVVVAAGVTYVMVQGKSSVVAPPLVAAVSSPKVMLADNREQNMPLNESVDRTQTGAIGKKAAAATDDAAASGAHPAAGVAPASDADADISAGKPPPGESPAPGAIAPAQPGGVPASASGDATPASDDGPGVGAHASAASAAAAIGSQPPTKPTDRPPGGVFIQFSAQKSETAARSSYHGLRTKFPTILGKLDPNIQRADLGDKGVFYRVRVGPFALADAQKICGDYKAVGGDDCLIARH
jgi:hypothetical protein